LLWYNLSLIPAPKVYNAAHGTAGRVSQFRFAARKFDGEFDGWVNKVKAALGHVYYLTY